MCRRKNALQSQSPTEKRGARGKKGSEECQVSKTKWSNLKPDKAAHGVNRDQGDTGEEKSESAPLELSLGARKTLNS